MNMRNLLLPLAVAAAAACGDHTTAPGGTGLPPIRVAGNWTAYINVISGPIDSCVVHAQFELRQNQNQDSFTGVGFGDETCYGTAEGAGEPQTFASPIGQGEITGNGIRFVVGGCVYLGTASGAPVNQIAGNVSCPYRGGTWHFTWAGRGDGST